MLQRLKMPDRDSELLAGLQMVERLLQGAFAEADRRGSHRGPKATQDSQCQVEALALFSNQIPLIHLHVIQNQLTDGVRSHDFEALDL